MPRRGLTTRGQQRPPVEAPREPELGRGGEVPFQVVGRKPARGHRLGQAPLDKFTATHSFFFFLQHTFIVRQLCSCLYRAQRCCLETRAPVGFRG